MESEREEKEAQLKEGGGVLLGQRKEGEEIGRKENLSSRRTKEHIEAEKNEKKVKKREKKGRRSIPHSLPLARTPPLPFVLVLPSPLSSKHTLELVLLKISHIIYFL